MLSILLWVGLGCKQSPQENIKEPVLVDADQDGFWVDEDCDDNNAAIHPNATEVCNGFDDNCNGLLDDADPGTDLSTGAVFYPDVDGDGFGDLHNPKQQCQMRTQQTEVAGDCDDSNADIHPEATEICNGVDDNCDQTIDQDAADRRTWYADVDVDGFGDTLNAIIQCQQPSGYVSDATDCDDSDAAIHPNATEVCNGFDDNCDGFGDDLDSKVDLSTGTVFYLDADGDGFGAPFDSMPACSLPAGYSDNNLDCDDSEAAVNPAATEICDGIDNDCSAQTGEESLVSAIDVNGQFTDVSSQFALMAAHNVSSASILWFCEGEYDVSITATHDLEIVGIGNNIRFIGQGQPIIDIENATLDIENISLSEGSPAIYASNASVTMTAVSFIDNHAQNGGALVASQSDIAINSSVFDANTATDKGGAVFLSDSVAHCSDSSFFSNQAVLYGGAFYSQDSEIQLLESYFYDNQSAAGGALFAESSSVSCSGSSSIDAGFEMNSATEAGVFIDTSTDFSAQECDFGADETEDNSAADIASNGGFSYFAADDASFTCANGVCGNSVAYSVGHILSNDYSSRQAFRGNVYEVVGQPTLDRFEMAMQFTSCVVDFYVFARPNELTAWQLLWHDSMNEMASTGWVNSGDIGLTMSEGQQILLGVGWSCENAADYYTFSSDTTSDYGLGTWAGLRSYDLDYLAVTPADFMPPTTNQSNYLYQQRVYVTRLQ